MAKNRSLPINVFYHICMINHYKEIVKEHLELIVSSGLYDVIDNIYIGCLGSKKEINNLHDILSAYDKIKIYSFDTNLEKFEFATLQVIEDICESGEEFYGLYIHTKGCSYPGNEGGKYWRDYMNYYNISQWEDCIDQLDIGYDTFGVKLLSAANPPSFTMHYSGNFFWFYSEYAATLPRIKELDRKNRFNAETWICSGSPIAGTACQLFVDYNTVGTFKPTQNEK